MIKLLFLILRLVAKTWRYQGNVPKDTPNISLGWHEETIAIAKAIAQQNKRQQKKWITLVSPSNDGKYLTNLLQAWQCKIIHGSTSKNSVKALYQIIHNAPRSKISTPADGSRGPRRQFHLGMLFTAQKTGVPIYLIRAKYKGIILKSTWDKTKIPYPFTKVSIVQSAPIYIDKNTTKEQLKILALELTAQLNNML